MLGPKSRRKIHARIRENMQRALLAKEYAPSPSHLSGGDLRNLRCRGANITSDNIMGRTHKGFSQGITGHLAKKQPKRWGLFETGARSIEQAVYLTPQKPAPKRDLRVMVRVGTTPERKLIVEDKETHEKKYMKIPSKPKYVEVGLHSSVPVGINAKEIMSV